MTQAQDMHPDVRQEVRRHCRGRAGHVAHSRRPAAPYLPLPPAGCHPDPGLLDGYRFDQP
jgi:hypothetical protein